MSYSFEDLREGYSRKLSAMVVGPVWKERADKQARIILSGKAKYQEIEGLTGVPWPVVGMLHMMEAACNFRLALHQGDPWNRVSTHVPKGRGPFLSWNDAAVDAIRMQKFHLIQDWSQERILYVAECMNGFGYRHSNINIPSPYLWSGSNVYTRGKFVEPTINGVVQPSRYDANAVSEQVGTAVLLASLRAMDESVDVALGADLHEPPVRTPEPNPAPVPPYKDDTSAGDLRNAGSRHLQINDWLRKLIFGGLFAGGTLNISSGIQDLKDTANAIMGLFTDNAGLIIVAAAIVVIVSLYLSDYFSVKAHREGRYQVGLPTGPTPIVVSIPSIPGPVLEPSGGTG